VVTYLQSLSKSNVRVMLIASILIINQCLTQNITCPKKMR